MARWEDLSYLADAHIDDGWAGKVARASRDANVEITLDCLPSNEAREAMDLMYVCYGRFSEYLGDTSSEDSLGLLRGLSERAQHLKSYILGRVEEELARERGLPQEVEVC